MSPRMPSRCGLIAQQSMPRSEFQTPFFNSLLVDLAIRTEGDHRVAQVLPELRKALLLESVSSVGREAEGRDVLLVRVLEAHDDVASASGDRARALRVAEDVRRRVVHAHVLTDRRDPVSY